MAVFSLLGWGADRKTYPMDVPAAGVKTITFDVQEGEFVLHGDPTAQKVSMRLSIDRMWIFRLGEEGILKRLIKVSGEGTDSLRIVTDIPHSISNWGRAQYPIDFEVVVPTGTNLNVIDTSGSSASPICTQRSTYAMALARCLSTVRRVRLPLPRTQATSWSAALPVPLGLPASRAR